MNMRIDFAPTEGVTGYRFRVIHHKYFSGADHYFMPFCSPSREGTRCRFGHSSWVQRLMGALPLSKTLTMVFS